jgi:hypothetical protein
MSHLDALDEYEAELELEIKREYRDVFSLFRYYVIAQDGAYLCNQANIEYIGEEPVYHLTLVDAWVWDAHRPMRLVKTVEIYSSSAVIIEELSHDGEAFTADDIAERMGHSAGD